MKLFSKYLLLFFGLWSVTAVSTAALPPTDAVVKVFVTSNSMDYQSPWQSEGTQVAGGSGSIISGNRILTNAHVVADHTFIQVKRNADPKKYTAKVEVIGYDCDLALLSVDDPDFFKDIKPLDFGQLPSLQDTVAVLGYPQGGDKLSITKGVVSRIELTSYVISSRKLLAVQIDAAINPGNSGGPVVKDGQIVGVAMQGYKWAQSIGYMIPIPVIEHFFQDLEDGTYDGFPVMGIEFHNTENKALRKFYDLGKDEGGILVNKVLPFSPAFEVIKAGDIILKIGDVSIGEDGTFAFQGGERLSMSYLITSQQIEGKISIKVKRNKKVKDVIVKLSSFVPLVPYPHHFKKPSYYIFGGLVFTVLSADLLSSWGERWWENAPLELSNYYFGTGRLNDKKRQELVVLLDVLSDDVNVGYHNQANVIITKVNDQEFRSFKEFVLLLNKIKTKEEYTLIETERASRIVLDNANIDQIDEKILNRNNIPYLYSSDVANWLGK